jgi:hypothetical protein
MFEIVCVGALAVGDAAEDLIGKIDADLLWISVSLG